RNLSPKILDGRIIHSLLVHSDIASCDSRGDSGREQNSAALPLRRSESSDERACPPSIYEKTDDVGGHATSHVDKQGFVWDEGGHVIFSHYKYFDNLIDKVLGKEVHERIRESWIVNGESWIPYPFQSNLRYLPKEVQVSCLVG